MKRVGIVISDISKGAGTERAVTNLSNMLIANEKYDVYIFSVYTLQSAICQYKLSDKVKIVHLGMKYYVDFRKIKNYIKLVTILNNQVNKYKLDYLLGTTHAYNSLLAFNSKCKRIACEHMNYDACPKISNYVRKMLYPRLDAVVLLTKADAEKYAFIDESRKYVISNSVSFTSEVPASLTEKRMIAVGRLTEQKGYDLLINMAIKLQKKLPDWHIDIYGCGEDKEKLINLIIENKVKSFVEIHEPESNIKKELLTSSIYLLTSRYEGLPMILLEAQACGLPIVAFDCPEGPSEVIQSESNGYLVHPFDIDEFINKTIKLANDEQLRYEFGNKAFENSKRFSENVVYEKWDSLFGNLNT